MTADPDCRHANHGYPVLRLYAENDRLKIRELEDRKRIQKLLGSCPLRLSSLPRQSIFLPSWARGHGWQSSRSRSSMRRRTSARLPTRH